MKQSAPPHVGMAKLAAVGILVAVVAVAAVGLALSQPLKLFPPQQPSASERTLVVIDMEAKQFRFDFRLVSPNDGVRQAFSTPPAGEYAAESKIVVLKGDTVRIRATSTDVVHGFGIIEYNLNVQIPPGETTIIEFKADQEGAFTFFCTVFCGVGHPQHKGTLIVKGS